MEAIAPRELGRSINCANLPTSDVALDYAFLPERKVFTFAASREAMQVIIDRLVD